MNDNAGHRSDPGALLDLKTIAARLDVSIKTVRRKIERGEIAYHRLDRLIRVSEAITPTTFCGASKLPNKWSRIS
jgi:excisionase family DNA binding protein